MGVMAVGGATRSRAAANGPRRTAREWSDEAPSAERQIFDGRNQTHAVRAKVAVAVLSRARGAAIAPGSLMVDALGLFGMFGGLERYRAALDFHSARHALLVSNLAHVDTPGFVPHDLSRNEGSDFKHVLEMAMRSPRHLAAASPTPTASVIEDRSAGAGMDGNYVSLDREAAKIAANQLRYDVIAQLASGHSLLYAVTDGKE